MSSIKQLKFPVSQEGKRRQGQSSSPDKRNRRKSNRVEQAAFLNRLVLGEKRHNFDHINLMKIQEGMAQRADQQREFIIKKSSATPLHARNKTVNFSFETKMKTDSRRKSFANKFGC